MQIVMYLPCNASAVDALRAKTNGLSKAWLKIKQAM